MKEDLDSSKSVAFGNGWDIENRFEINELVVQRTQNQLFSHIVKTLSKIPGRPLRLHSRNP